MREISICKLNLQKKKHKQRIYVTCLNLCHSSVTRSVIIGRSENEHELPWPNDNQWTCDIFSFGRSLASGPLTFYLKSIAHCLWEGQGKKKRWFPIGRCFPMAAEMCCANRGPQWRFSLDCWPALQIFTERSGGFVLLARSWGHNLQQMAGWSVTQIPGPLDWKRNCVNTPVFIISAVKYRGTTGGWG